MDDDYKALLKQKPALEALLASEGWSILRGIIEQQAKTRSNLILMQPVGRVDGVGLTAAQQEFMKGEVTQLLTFLRLPELVVEQAKQLIQEENDVKRSAGTDNSEPDGRIDSDEFDALPDTGDGIDTFE